jgi:hypothetical protein
MVSFIRTGREQRISLRTIALALAVAAPKAFTSAHRAWDAGAVSVKYGSTSGLTSTNNQFWHQNSADIISTARAGDLAIGVPGEDVIGPTKGSRIADAGAVHVIYYAAIGTGLSAAAGPGNQFFT